LLNYTAAARKKEVVYKLVKEMPVGCYTVNIERLQYTRLHSHYNPEAQPVFLANVSEP
jgi:hypothetical protein